MMKPTIPTANDTTAIGYTERADNLTLELLRLFHELGQTQENRRQEHHRSRRRATMFTYSRLELALGYFAHASDSVAPPSISSATPRRTFFNVPGFCWLFQNVQTARRIGKPASCNVESCRVNCVIAFVLTPPETRRRRRPSWRPGLSPSCHPSRGYVSGSSRGCGSWLRASSLDVGLDFVLDLLASLIHRFIGKCRHHEPRGVTASQTAKRTYVPTGTSAWLSPAGRNHRPPEHIHADNNVDYISSKRSSRERLSSNDVTPSLDRQQHPPREAFSFHA